MNYENPAFEALLMDQEAGASSLLYRFIQILTDGFEDPALRGEMNEMEFFEFLYDRVLDAHPLMAIFPNLSRYLAEKQRSDSQKALHRHLNEFKNDLNKNIQETIQKCAEVFSGSKRIFTFSHSSIVRKALLEMKKQKQDFTVNITESRPVREGVGLAKVLSRSGIKINLFADAAMERALEMSDLVLVGTDWYWDGGFVNKIGTHAVLRISREKEIPFAILSDSSKEMDRGPEDWSRDAHASSLLFSENDRNIQVFNPYFEAMNYHGVSHCIIDGTLRAVPPGAPS